MLFSDELLAYLFETYNDVSILVVMDAVLRLKDSEKLGSLFISLNPCCNGCCSQTSVEYTLYPIFLVSILVVMDAVLRLSINRGLNPLNISLNPCCNGCCSQTPAPLLTGIAGCVSILVVMDAVLRRAFFIPHKV